MKSQTTQTSLIKDKIEIMRLIAENDKLRSTIKELTVHHDYRLEHGLPEVNLYDNLIAAQVALVDRGSNTHNFSVGLWYLSRITTSYWQPPTQQDLGLVLPQISRLLYRVLLGILRLSDKSVFPMVLFTRGLPRK